MDERKQPLDYAPPPAQPRASQILRCVFLTILSALLALLALGALFVGVANIVYLASHDAYPNGIRPRVDFGDLDKAITPLLIGLVSGFFSIHWMRDAAGIAQAIQERRR